jgi:hypothetical protein
VEEVHGFDLCVPILPLDLQSSQLYTLVVVQAFLIAPFVSSILSYGLQYGVPVALLRRNSTSWRPLMKLFSRIPNLTAPPGTFVSEEFTHVKARVAVIS